MTMGGDHITGWGFEKRKDLGWEVGGPVSWWTAHTEQGELERPLGGHLSHLSTPPRGPRTTLSTHSAFGVSAQEELGREPGADAGRSGGLQHGSRAGRGLPSLVTP